MQTEKRTPREFKAGDHVYLHIRPRKNSLRMGACVKVTPRYCGPFEILDRVVLHIKITHFNDDLLSSL
jgi:hypothetical protein